MSYNTRTEGAIKETDGKTFKKKTVMKKEVELLRSVKEYEWHLKFHNRSETTIHIAIRCIGNLVMWLLKQGLEYTNELGLKEIKKYLRERYYHINAKGRQNQASTRNREISRIRQYLRYLYEKEYISEPLAEKVELVKEARLVIPKDILNKRELLKLFKIPDTGTILGYRDRMIFELLYATGMRRAELCKLKTEDIDFEARVVFIREGKGKKDRVVPVCDTTLKYVQHYIKYVRPYLKKNYKQQTKQTPGQDQELVLSVNGKAIKPNKLNDLLEDHFRKAKFKKRVTIHSLRHTVATHLLQKGMPLRQVQEFLGHEDLNTTAKYLHLQIRDLQREYKRCHPRELEN